MLIWCVTVFAAYFVKGVAGFGNSLVHMGVMAYFRDNAELTPIDLILTVPANLSLTWKYRRCLKRRIWLPAALAAVAMLIPGALILRDLDARIVKLIFGPLIILLGLNLLRKPEEPAGGQPERSRAVTWGLILLSGVVSGMFGIGALIAVAMARMVRDSRELKANMSAVFLADNAGRTLIYALTGLLTAESLLRSLLLAPAMAAGLFLGMRLAGRFSERTVRLCVVGVLVASGVLLIAANL